ncbi:hypothetical protein EYB45_00145 [Erythrobacteraceae bacterium CFH 75059]|nr:hypothetical protein EYB45_00145 [Erythrobacteraceae bacterium CFH 75059]
MPAEPLRLTGAVDRPVPGTLPLRGDLAHIALARTHLVQNYVAPLPGAVGARPTSLRLQPAEDSPVVAELAPAQPLEILDRAGAWIWVCLGPQGPSGYVPASALA